MIVAKIPGGIDIYYMKGEWFADRNKAVEKVNNIRLARIISLEKQIKKLQIPIK